METVVFRSDIERIVLRYLQDQQLEEVSRVFCKTSPFLKQEFIAYKKGLQGHSFFPPLEEIICEYVKTARKVDKMLSGVSEEVRFELRECSLSDKISTLLGIRKNIASVPKPTEKVESASNVESSESVQVDKVNLSNKCSTKRKRRSCSSSSREASSECRRFRDCKRRRMSLQFCFLSPKQEHCRLEDENLEETTDSCEEEETELDNESDLSRLVKPINESTPNNRLLKPKLPEIAQAILDNAEFQMKLVNNINEALSTANSEENLQKPTEKSDEPCQKAEEKPQVTSKQLLDEMVKNILDATERDPTFDAIIEEVVGACGDFEVRQAAIPVQATGMVPSSLEPPAVSGSSQPRTPLIIRHALASANTDANPMQVQLLPQAAPNNSFTMYMDPTFSISKLVVMNSGDSAQKNPAALADQTEMSIGNSTAEHLMNHLGSGTNDGGTATTTDCNNQLYFDGGPLTFPVYISNDGVVTPITFISSSNGSEIPANINQCLPVQQPLGLSSCSAANGFVELPKKAQQAVIQPSPTATAATDAGGAKNDADLCVLTERVTPSTSGIVNTKIAKSFSTPRKRASHVRTLSFSPACSATPLARSGATPHSTRRQAVAIKTATILEGIVEENSKSEPTSATFLEKPIIRNVEILPQFLKPPDVITASESESNSSVQPFFVGEEGSNQTIIRSEIAITTGTSVTVASSQSDHTPKRKQPRSTAVRRCKRQISKSSNDDEKLGDEKLDDEKPAGDHTKTNKPVEKKTVLKTVKEKSPAKPAKDSCLEEWVKMRNCTINDLDTRLRALNAEVIDSMPVPPRKKYTKKKLRGGKRGRMCSTREAEQKAKDKNQQETEKSNEKKSHECIEKQPKNGDNKPPPQPHIQVVTVAENERRTANIGYLLDTPFKAVASAEAVDFIPPTPGIFLPSIDLQTPLSKAKPYEGLVESAAYLFGSLSKSELGSPLLNAITPGFRFTPLIAKDTTTPRSVATTEYSSGGSYYKPDESEDLDRNIDKMLRDSAQKRLEGGSQALLGISPAHVSEPIVTMPSSPSPPAMDLKSDTQLCAEILVEKLKVAPIVLKRVKSFGQDGNEGTELVETEANGIDPHYTLVSGLPETHEPEEDEGDIHLSTSSSTTTSSQSSSSRSSSSSSSSSDDSSDSECGSRKHRKSPSSNKKLAVDSQKKLRTSLSLENLSVISSTEDEDWNRIDPNVINCDNKLDDNSQLIGNDGEVRYPVRSWLTPRKPNTAAANSDQTTKSITETINMASPVKSPVKSEKPALKTRRAELDLKRDRMKEKLKQDVVHPKLKPKVERSVKFIVPSKTLKLTLQALDKPVEKPAEKPMDVLDAVKLSAKNHAKIVDVGSSKSTSDLKVSPTFKASPTLGSVDDNAVSIILADPAIAVKEAKAAKTSPAALKSLLSEKANIVKLSPPVQRKCMQIEALPAIKSSSRSISKTKQIVRTPLGFKGGAGSTTSTTSSTLKIPSKKAPKIILPTPAGSAKGSKTTKKETLRASPRLIDKEAKSNKTEKLKQTRSTPLKTTTKKPTATTKKQQKETPSEKDTEKQSRAKCVQPKKINTKSAEPAVATEKNAAQTKDSPAAALKPASESNKPNEEMNCDEDEYDPMEDCSLTKFTESDQHFITLTYQGPDDVGSTNPSKAATDLSQFKMNVFLSSTETVTWRLSNEILLYESAPATPSKSPQRTALIRNIPKKRRIRITSSSTTFDDTDCTVTAKTVVDSKSPIPAPRSPKSLTTSDSEQRGNGIQSPTRNRNESNAQSQSESVPNSADRIEITDIESILSHLHGT